MKKLVSLLTIALVTLYTSSISANAAFPVLIWALALYKSAFLIIISIIIEALLFYWLIPHISYIKAGLMSLIGNAASALLGTVLGFFFPLYTYYIYISDDIHALGLTWILDWLSMLLISALIEGITLRLIFGYKGKQLWIPVFIGNIITYILLFYALFFTNLRIGPL